MGGTNWSSLITYDQCVEKIIKYHMSSRLISVGSGYGVLEKHIENTYKQKQQKLELICIDPEPTSYSFENYPKTPLIFPQYAYIDAYIDDYLGKLQIQLTKEEINNCDLLLCWPSPNESTYDLEAIIKLQPIKVFIIYEMTGAAGSNSLHNWIYKECTNIPDVHVPLWLNNENATIFKKEGYKCIDSIVCEYIGQFQYAFLVLSRE
jgi:hypothetical protein